jgi:non-ribosomal peptide synthetase component F
MAREVPNSFSSLRYLLFGGEVVDPKSVEAVIKAGAPEHLLHVYGPTENTTFTSWYEVQVPLTSIPIGKAIANTQIYLLDAHLQTRPYRCYWRNLHWRRWLGARLFKSS